MAVTIRKEPARNATRLQPDSRPALTAAGVAAYKMPMEELKAKVEAEFAEKALEQRGLDVSAAIDVWIEKHPEYANVDGAISQKNATAIVEELGSPEGLTEMQRGGRLVPDARAPKGFKVFPNFWDLEMAADRAAAKGKLTAHQGEQYKQRVESLRQQVSLSPAAEDEAYSMPLHELRRRCTPGSYDPLGPKE